MKTHLSLDNLFLFLCVADAGSLSAAAERTGTSLPTLSRRMTRLEADSGRRLFLRGTAGYALTAEGKELEAEALSLRTIAERVDRWQSQGPSAVRVRITAGLWTSRLLARNIRTVWSTSDIWSPDFLASNRNVDIARREADIGIRNRRPEQEWLAGRRTGQIDYAEYGIDSGVQGYVALPENTPSTPSERWLRERHSDAVVMLASDTRLAMELATAGAGRVVLPTFVGDTEPTLQRLSPPIAEISHEEWLVCHHDARHDPPVRAAIDALVKVLSDTSLRRAPTSQPQEATKSRGQHHLTTRRPPAI